MIDRRRFLRAAAASGVAYAFGRTPDTFTRRSPAVERSPTTRRSSASSCSAATTPGTWSCLEAMRNTCDTPTRGRRSRSTQASLLPISWPSSTTAGHSGFEPGDGGPAAVVQRRPVRDCRERRPTRAPTTHDAVSGAVLHAAAAAVLAQRSAGSVALAQGKSDVQNRMGRTHRRPARSRDARPAAGPQCVAVRAVAVSGGRTRSAVHDGSRRPVEFLGFGADALAVSRRAGVHEPRQRKLHIALRARIRRRPATRLAVLGSREFCARCGAALATVFPGSNLATQLRTVARLIAVRDRLDHESSQIFFVATGGFDSHDNQETDRRTARRSERRTEGLP